MRKKVLINVPWFYGIDESIKKAFEWSGFEVILLNNRIILSIQEKIAQKIGNKFSFIKPISNPILKYYLLRENHDFLNLIQREKPDIIFIIKGEHLFPDTIKTLKSQFSMPVISYIWDDPFYAYAGQFSDDYRKNNFVKGMHLYDYIFVYDPHYAGRLNQHGIKNVSYLPLATNPSKYRPVILTEQEKDKYGFDLCFVGTPHPNRIELLDSISGFNLGVFGDARWERLHKPYYKGRADVEKALKIYSASKIVLNIHDPDAVYGVNTRTFNIPACGAFELVDYKKEIDNLFTKEEIVYYTNVSDLKTKIKYYLERPEKRKTIAERGKEKVLKNHTWHHRIEQVVNELNKAKLL